MRKINTVTKIYIIIIVYLFLFVNGSRLYDEGSLMEGTIFFFLGVAFLWYTIGLTVYKKIQQKITLKKFCIILTIPLIFISAFLVLQSPYFTIKKEVYKISKELGVELSKVKPHMKSIDIDNDRIYSVDIYSDNFYDLSFEAREEYLSELRSINRYSGPSIFSNWYIRESSSWVHSNGKKYTLEKKTESISNNNNSFTKKKEKCINCNGTGTVKYYYGSSDLEAVLSGHDPYTFGSCSMCNGTGWYYE